MSHLGRALDKLGAEIICANSPQAKGRVERANSTLQNRLVKAMRLEGIPSIEEAHSFLPSFLLRHNAQFGCPPGDPRNAHRPLAPHENVESEMVWRVERSVTGTLALHNNKAMFILEPTPLARKRVHVCDFPDGRIEVRHGEVVLPYQVYDKMQRVNQAEVVENKRLGAALAMARALQSANPHHRQRNNNAPARSSQSVGVFAPSRNGVDDGRPRTELPKKGDGHPSPGSSVSSKIL